MSDKLDIVASDLVLMLYLVSVEQHEEAIDFVTKHGITIKGKVIKDPEFVITTVDLPDKIGRRKLDFLGDD